MGLAILLYFVVLLGTLAAHRSAALAATPFVVPLSEPYHDENIPALRNFSPWILAAVLLIIVAYYPPIRDIVRSNFQLAPGYSPDSPALVEKTP
jgi:hypothetical protein